MLLFYCCIAGSIIIAIILILLIIMFVHFQSKISILYKNQNDMNDLMSLMKKDSIKCLNICVNKTAFNN